jgi:aminopeptidase YwaD
MRKFILLLLILSPFFVRSQTGTGAAERIIRDIAVLAADSMNGREAGTQGEFMAMQFIAQRFRELELRPLFGDTSFFNAFTYSDGPCVAAGSWMNINGKPLNLYLDYYPLSYSKSDTISSTIFDAGYGIDAPATGYSDYTSPEDIRGKCFLIRLSAPENLASDPAYQQHLSKVAKIRTAIKKGASAVIFITEDKAYGTPSPEPRFYDEKFSIPVFFLSEPSLFIVAGVNTIDAGLNFFRGNARTAYNVAAYMDNGAATTVVIGAHYDHVGMGFFGSLGEDIRASVHNGADDNASGTAGIFELARLLKESSYRNNNYIFVAFSAEEKGLLGSVDFIKKIPKRFSPISYMVNLDMIGRYSPNKGLLIYGTGTSPVFKKEIKAIREPSMKVTQIKSGVGGSDHMSFYLSGTPALFFHTGLHSDYHRPADDTRLINAEGAAQVVYFAYQLIGRLDSRGMLPYKKTTAWQAMTGLRHFL